MPSPQKLDELLLDLGDTVLSSDWEGWLTRASHVFRARRASLTPIRTPLSNSVEGIAVGIPSEQRSVYAEYYNRLDLWRSRLSALPPGTARSLEMLVPEDELLKSEIFTDYMKPAGVRYACGVAIETTSSRFLLGFSRSREDGNFDDRDLKAIASVANHLQKSLRVEQHLRAAEVRLEGTLHTLNMISHSIFLLDAGLRILFANAAATDTARCGDLVDAQAGRVRARNRGCSDRFNLLLERAVAVPGELHSMKLVAADNDRDVTAIVLGIPTASRGRIGLEAAGPAVALFLIDHVRPPLPVDHLVSVFGLTPKEADTASLLAAGANVDEISDRLSVSRETVRFHLRHLFWKTGTHNQRELGQLLTTALGAFVEVAQNVAKLAGS